MHISGDPQENVSAQNLMTSFMQFKRMGWHQRSIDGCKPSEIRVLFIIQKSEEHIQRKIKVSEISKYLHVTSPTVTQLLKGLEVRGLIERKPDAIDRRSVVIELTQKGEQVTQKAHEHVIASFAGLVEQLGEEQSQQLAELLSRVTTYFQEKEASSNQSPWSGDEEV
jgi:DNA-binding MarR family transcriptional regulator